jgi:hypothetical protein
VQDVESVGEPIRLTEPCFNHRKAPFSWLRAASRFSTTPSFVKIIEPSVVVDPQLRVRGVGPTNAPTFMVAGKAAQLILA